jgi:protein-tyrosine phosphatase
MIRPMNRIDVHSHLLPAVDDGCPTLEESLTCARMLVEAGYSHCICTPHVWAGYRNIARDSVPLLVDDLQSALNSAAVPLRLLPGSELNLHATVTQYLPEKIIDLALAGRYILVDMWADKMPEWFAPAIRWLQGLNLTVILAHPERMRMIQDHPELTVQIMEMGVLLQGNLQCFADRPESHTRRTAELLLDEARYFVLGSDLHNSAGLRTRLVGLENAIEFAGNEVIDRLTIDQPRMFLPAEMQDSPPSE